MKKTWFCVSVMLLCAVTEARGAISWKQCLSRPEKWYESELARQIADNVLLYQRNDGGWHKNTDMAKPLTAEERTRIIGDKLRDDSTIDNGATIRQMRYLARVYRATGADRFRASFDKALDYLLRAQYQNGGWPQFYPRTKGYYRHITFNDGAMINVMNLLRDVGRGKEPFGFVDQSRRNRCEHAVLKGIECILKCQIVVDGRELAWCAQHDEDSFAPADARTYEKASLSGSESVGIVAFLMQIDNPSPEIIDSIQSAVKWFDQVKLTGIRQVKKTVKDAPKGYDKIIVKDDNAPPLWARFYEIGTNRPIFCSRDGVIRYNLSEISYERRNGYSWYVDGPAKLLNKLYPTWKKRWAPDRNVLKRK
ncbi:MAG: pectate lyase [Planctomycetota bacterium]|jgi:PelA/Pel-15E family pectate lyase